MMIEPPKTPIPHQKREGIADSASSGRRREATKAARHNANPLMANQPFFVNRPDMEVFSLITTAGILRAWKIELQVSG